MITTDADAAIVGEERTDLSYAKNHELDMIVTSTHGSTGLTPFLLGSTARRIVRHAPCRVLVLPICIVKSRPDHNQMGAPVSAHLFYLGAKALREAIASLKSSPSVLRTVG